MFGKLIYRINKVHRLEERIEELDKTVSSLSKQLHELDMNSRIYIGYPWTIPSLSIRHMPISKVVQALITYLDVIIEYVDKKEESVKIISCAKRKS